MNVEDVGGGEGGVGAADEDLISWEDSERFEEDSLCSWMSEPESMNQNWRGWSARAADAPPTSLPSTLSYTGGIGAAPLQPPATHPPALPRLLELSARLVASTKSAEEIDYFSNSQTNRLYNVRDEVSYPFSLFLRSSNILCIFFLVK